MIEELYRHRILPTLVYEPGGTLLDTLKIEIEINAFTRMLHHHHFAVVFVVSCSNGEALSPRLPLRLAFRAVPSVLQSNAAAVSRHFGFV